MPTQIEIAELVNSKWNAFQEALKASGHNRSTFSIEYAQFLAQQLMKRNISKVTMEVRAGQPFLNPSPLEINPTEFVIPKPTTLWERIEAWFFKKEYARIRKAEAELTELNTKFREYIQKVMPDPTSEVAARLGLQVPKGVRIISSNGSMHNP